MANDDYRSVGGLDGALGPADRLPPGESTSPILPVSGLRAPLGLLLSGGLDSAILLGLMLRDGHRVVPFYVRMGCVWQERELGAARQFLSALAGPKLAELVLLEMPVEDLYEDHWSVSGRAVPDQRTAHHAVFLPGRNPLLLIKPMLWCQLHGVPRLALATLAGNPFDDAAPEFFSQFQSMMSQATGGRVEVLRPFERMSKREVMWLGKGLPLELTFSCLAPVDGQHCGRCNKCAERAAAFRHLEASDPTCYAHTAAADAARAGGACHGQ